MARLTNEQRLIKAKQDRAKAEQDVRRAKKAIGEADRKADTRRKIILGGILLDAARTKPGVAKFVGDAVASLTRDADKAVFADFELPAPPTDPESS